MNKYGLGRGLSSLIPKKEITKVNYEDESTNIVLVLTYLLWVQGKHQDIDITQLVQIHISQEQILMKVN